jgi:hypothetical protein
MKITQSTSIFDYTIPVSVLRFIFTILTLSFKNFYNSQLLRKGRISMSSPVLTNDA